MSMPESAFAEMVAADVRNQLDRTKAKALRSPENLDRWHDCLVVLAGKVDAQFSVARSNLIAARNIVEVQSFPVTVFEGEENELHFESEIEYRQWVAEQARWKAGAVRFKMAIEERLLEARGLRREANVSSGAFISAIIAHRDHECDETCEPNCRADGELWSVLSEKTARSGQRNA